MIHLRAHGRTLAFASALSLAASMAVAPASAQERKPVEGTSVSLTPPKGFEPATGFAGLMNKATQASVLVVEMPPEAYPQLSTLFADGDAAKAGFAKQNVTIAKREQLDVAGAKVPLLAGSQIAPNGAQFDKWIALFKGDKTVMITVQSPKTAKLPEAQVRAMVASVSLGKEPTIEVKLAALPFAIKPAAPFRVIDTLAGSGVMMTVGEKNTDPEGAQPLMIAVHQTVPSARPGQEEALAETLLKSTQNLEEATIAERRHLPFAGGEGMLLRGTFQHPNGSAKAFVQYLGIGTGGRFVRLLAMVDEARLAELQPAIEQTAASIAFTAK
jgi:hypothetical protein